MYNNNNNRLTASPRGNKIKYIKYKIDIHRYVFAFYSRARYIFIYFILLRF